MRPKRDSFRDLKSRPGWFGRVLSGMRLRLRRWLPKTSHCVSNSRIWKMRLRIMGGKRKKMLMSLSVQRRLWGHLEI